MPADRLSAELLSEVSQLLRSGIDDSDQTAQRLRALRKNHTPTEILAATTAISAEPARTGQLLAALRRHARSSDPELNDHGCG